MRVLILANGDPPPTVLAHSLADESDLVIFTDGATYNGVSLGLTPNLISGDFDGIPIGEAARLFPDAIIERTPDQEKGDLEKAIDLALGRGATTITIVGAGGGRIDHELANYLLLARFAGQVDICILDAWSEARVVAGAQDHPEILTFETDIGDTISLIPLTDGVRVTLTGTRWTLNDEALTFGTRGVSNVAEHRHVKVQARGGRLLVCRLRIKART